MSDKVTVADPSAATVAETSSQGRAEDTGIAS